MCFWLGLETGGSALVIALVVVANATTALDPVTGFTVLVRSSAISGHSAGGQALTAWVRSGRGCLPTVVEHKVVGLLFVLSIQSCAGS